MRLLHCSDIHLGKRVNGFSMMEEQRYVLTQIEKIALQRQVDGIVIAGDVYDQSVPSVEAVQLLNDFLTSLAQKHLPVYLISGNHDSPERLNFGNRLLTQSGIHLEAVFSGTLRKMVLEDEYGPLNLYLMPFIKPSMVRPFYPDCTIGSYSDAVETVLAHSDIDPSARNVLVAHQFVTNHGQEPERCDSETLSIGGVDQVDGSLFDDFDYVALGHLHGPQLVLRETVRYCGSPLKYSFSECRHRKSVTIVTLKEKGVVELETEPLTPLRDLREIRGSLSTLLEPLIVQQGNPEDYLRVILTDEEMIYDPMGQLRKVYPNVMRLDVENSRTTAETVSATAADRVEEKSPLELFCDFYETVHGGSMTAEETAVIADLLAGLEENPQ